MHCLCADIGVVNFEPLRMLFELLNSEIVSSYDFVDVFAISFGFHQIYN